MILVHRSCRLRSVLLTRERRFVPTICIWQIRVLKSKAKRKSWSR
jgi:hypothetical protein